MFEGGWALASVWYPTPTILLGLSWLVNQLRATERARGLFYWSEFFGLHVTETQFQLTCVAGEAWGGG